MKNWGLVAFVWFVFALFCIGTIAWQVYAYYDCLYVGHSKLYCIMRFGQ